MLSLKKLKPQLQKLFLFLAVAVLTITLSQDILFTLAPLKNLDLKLIDDRFVHRGEIDIKDSADVIILEVTQESYNLIPDSLRVWPWPRSIFSKVIENLMNAGAKAVGIDFVMSDPDRLSPANDSMLINTIRKHGSVVVAGKTSIREAARLAYSEVTYEMVQYRDTTYEDQKINFNNIFFNADSSIGIVQVPVDYDNVNRRYNPMVVSTRAGNNLPSFGFALLNKYYNLSQRTVVKREENDFIFAEKKIPRFDKQSMLVNFYGADGTFPRVEFAHVLDDSEFLTQEEIDLDAEINYWEDPDIGLLYSGIFENKVVIIGSTLPEDKDYFNIPFSKGGVQGRNLLYGVEYHANVIQNVIWDSFLYKQSRFSEIIFLILIVFVTFFGSNSVKQIKVKYQLLTEVINFFLVVVLIYLIYFLGFYLFANYNYVISIVSPVIAVVLAYFSSTAFHLLKERSQNKMIRGMFSTYVSKDLVNELLQNPDKLKLGGEKRNLSIMFSDIAGFTTISEKMTPEGLVDFINAYLTEMTGIVIRNKGTLDKYLGDAIMAFWGAPISIKEHEYLACLTAVEMQKRLIEMRKEWNLSEDTNLSIRIGINSGDVVVGNIGGQNRFDYTVMGDNVNLASRLEGANKMYGSGIMISENTFAAVKEKIFVRELDNIRVKGKIKPTKVYELIDIIDDSRNQEYSWIGIYDKAISEYKSRNFESSKKLFSDVLSIKPDDETAKLYIERCAAYIANPPDDDWDGVFVMKTK